MTLHSPDFDPDERAVTLGMRLVAEILWDQLENRRLGPVGGEH